MSATVADRAAEVFRAYFGFDPQAIACANGRVNLIGDHVDYAGGMVLPMAIAAQTAVALAANRSGEDQFHSAAAVDRAWSRYAQGVLVELRARGIAVPPVSLAVESDVPVGAGLSSSAALEVAVARAALRLIGATMPARDIALLCQRAEHLHAGVPCGIMDQWCVAHANPDETPRHAMLLDCSTLSHRTVELPSALRIETFDSGVRHTLGDGAYAARRNDIEQAAEALELRELARANIADLERLRTQPNRVYRRARHVITECARVTRAVHALEAGDVREFGAILSASHASLRDDFEVSTPELNALVERACADGAFGARLTGAGFGGSIVAVFPAASLQPAT